MDSLQRRLGMIGGLGGSQETIDQLQEALAGAVTSALHPSIH